MRTPAADIRYFGYGSNLCLDRLEHRLGGDGTVVPLDRAALHGYDLRFHKRSEDPRGRDRPSAKADAFRTDHPEDVVLGVVFRIKADRMARLDRAEGLGDGYRSETVIVAMDGQDVPVRIYVAEAIDASLEPYDWYKRLALVGAQRWELDAEYVEQKIAQVASRPDPVDERDRRERAWRCTAPSSPPAG